MNDRNLEFKGMIIIDDPVRFVKRRYDLKEYFRRRKHKESVIKTFLRFSTTIRNRINTDGPVMNITSRPTWSSFTSD